MRQLWKHLRRGSYYREVGLASLQVSDLSKLQDGASMMVYRSLADGTLWVRAEGEFRDGRFVKVEDRA